MTRPFGAAAALAAALLLAFSPATAQPATGPAVGQWPQAVSDLKADPAVRFGALPNGMRYAIRKQSIPAGQAALRLWFDTGSLMETDGQQGLAHFLEHMAFNGSRSIPEGELIPILERHGLAFGADTNASTGFEETVYKLDLPQTDEDTVQASLLMLRETASELLIAQEAVERERGIAAGNKADAQAAFNTSVSVIDRIADKGIVHKNKAARHKSRLSAAVKAIA